MENNMQLGWVDQLSPVSVPGPDARLVHDKSDADAIRILKLAYVQHTRSQRETAGADTLWHAQYYLADPARYLETECRINELALCGQCGEVHSAPACEAA